MLGALIGILQYGSATYSPPTANLVGHWDSSVASSVHIGTNVAQWDDLSGNSNHLLQATGSKQPVYSGTGTTSTITFDGVDDALKAIFTLSQPFTLYLVMKTITNRNNDVIFDGANNNTTQLQEGIYPAFNLQGVNNSINTGITTGVFQVITSVVNTGSNSSVCVQNTFDNLGGGNVGAGVPGGLNLSGRAGGFGPSNIAISEAYMYSVAHSLSAITVTETNIINYLRTKWGI